MAYSAPSSQTTGDLITAAIWNQDVVDNMAFLAGLKKGGTALSGLTAETELQDPDYDSGWFAVTTNTGYTKAHSLGTKPRHVVIWHSTASDGDSDWVEVTTVEMSGGDRTIGNILVNATNVIATTATDGSAGTLASMSRSSASGYYRILAWI